MLCNLGTDWKGITGFYSSVKVLYQSVSTEIWLLSCCVAVDGSKTMLDDLHVGGPHLYTLLLTAHEPMGTGVAVVCTYQLTLWRHCFCRSYLRYIHFSYLFGLVHAHPSPSFFPPLLPCPSLATWCCCYPLGLFPADNQANHFGAFLGLPLRPTFSAVH
jgi:hypothetical protein